MRKLLRAKGRLKAMEKEAVMKRAILAQMTHVVSSSINLKITYFQRETPMKPSSATAISHPNIALAM